MGTKGRPNDWVVKCPHSQRSIQTDKGIRPKRVPSCPVEAKKIGKSILSIERQLILYRVS